MTDKMSPGPVCSNAGIREAVCIHTSKVYDSCRSKECIQDIRVYPTRCSQAILDKATSVKAKYAKLLWVSIDVEPITFNKGFYTVDVRYFYKVMAEAFCGIGRPHEIVGLAAFDKRTILCGGEGSARIFSSRYVPNDSDIQTVEKNNMPNSVVEVVDPILLDVKLVEHNHHHHHCGCDLTEVPACVCCCFEDDVTLCDEGKRLFVTLGQFSIIRLERDIQLLIPSYDVCMPEKECCCSSDQNPCELFQNVNFPVNEFFPPDCSTPSDNCRCGCGCDDRKKDVRLARS